MHELREAKQRCHAGDLALLICSFRGNTGRVVRVIARRQDHPAEAFLGPVWTVDAASWPPLAGQPGGVVAEAWLVPLCPPTGQEGTPR